MSRLNRYGKNEWKRRTLNLLVTLLIFIIAGILFGGGYIILKPKYELYKQERVRKEQEEKRQQEKILAQTQKPEETEQKQEAGADMTKLAETNKVPEQVIKESQTNKAAEEEAAKRIQEEIEERRKEEEAKQVPAETSANQTSDYIIPSSNQKYLSNSDIAHLSLREINYAKNEIYARHGRKFKSPELQRYFGSKSWYYGTIEPDYFDSSVFNDYERKNAEFLSSVEMSMSPGGYELDQ